MRKPRDFIESLSRGVDLLSVLSQVPSPLSLTELSRKTNLSKSTVQRVTHTLVEMGYLNRDDGTKRYSIGQKSISLALRISKNLDLRRIAFPFLDRTSKEIGETVNLAILDGEEIVYVERIKTEQILNINLHVGSRLPAHCTSMGKAILAFLPKDRLEKVLKGLSFGIFTKSTIDSKTKLLRELKRVKEKGYATNNEELSIGLRSVAAPVIDYSGQVIAAVNVAVPSIRVSLKHLEDFLSKKVVETADQISFTLGWKAAEK